MEKYFVTYQPQRVSDILSREDYAISNTYYHQIRDEFGYNPIFFIPLENKLDFLIKNFFSTPSKPDVMIITKEHEYDCIDVAKWYEIKGNKKAYDTIKVNISDKVEKEFISEKILKNNVIKIISVDEMIDNIPVINIDVKTKMLLYSQKFWEVLEQYFWKSDERDMYKFVISNQFAYVIGEFEKIMHDHNMVMAGIMQWFRDKISEAGMDFNWF